MKKYLLVFILQFSLHFLNAQNSDSIAAAALYNEGVVLYNQENYMQAISKFESAIKLNRKMAKAHFQNGLSYKRIGSRKESIKYFSKAIDLNPQYLEAYGYRAYAYFEEEKYKRALADFDAVIQLDSLNLCLYLSRGEAKFALDDYTGAIDDYLYLIERKAELTSSEFAMAIFLKGEAEYFRGNKDDAYMDFSSVVGVESLNSEPLLYLAAISTDYEYYREAIEFLNECLEIDSLNAEALYYRAVCTYNLNIDDFGEADLQKSVDLGYERAKMMMEACF